MFSYVINAAYTQLWPIFQINYNSAIEIINVSKNRCHNMITLNQAKSKQNKNKYVKYNAYVRCKKKKLY